MRLNNYKFKTELHAHSKPVSTCSEIIPERLIEMYKKAGADAVVLTNHFYPGFFEGGKKEAKLKFWFNDYYELKKFGEKCGISVILGMEIRFTENFNDYLVYGIDEEDAERAFDYLDKGIDVFYREFKNDRNVILQAHPFRRNMVLANPESIDGIEVFNMHPNHNSSVAMAAKYAKENNFLISGGTDYHHEGHHGCCFMKTDFIPKDSFDVAKIIKEKKFLLEIFGNTIIPYNMQ